MDKNFDEKINEIRASADIVDVVSRHIDVIKKGRNYFAICPFHDDTNPSLSISQDKQIFKCFVCGTSGNVFTFIQKYKKVPFISAVKEVADMVGKEFSIKENNKPTEVINYKTQVLYDIVNDATLFYKNSLLSNIEATTYCKDRDLSIKTISDFNIGYSIDQNKLISYLLAKGYKNEDIFRSGIAIESDGELKDRFAERLIFPITDLNGKIVAFSGRIIKQSEMAKYVNSPETEIFIKGNTLYNYFNALPYIKQEKCLYICEGYMDCIALTKAGINNAVALMGTAFTKEHLKIFKYLGVTIILALDGDNAGNTNANKLANELTDLHIDTKVIPSYEDCKDLDEYLKKYGPEKLKEHLNNVKMSSFDFNFYIASKLNLLTNNEDKKKFLKKMCNSISKMDEVDADIYEGKLHDELGFSLSTIRALVEEAKKNESKDVNVISEVRKYKKLTKLQDLQVRLISSMFDSKEAIEMYIESLIYIDDEAYRKIANMISEYYEENKESFNIDFMVADLYTKVSTNFSSDEKLVDALSLIDSCKENFPHYNQASFSDLLYQIDKIAPLEEKLNQINEEIKFATRDEISNYIKEAIELKRQIAELKKK